MLTIIGLVASAGVLYLGTLFADISIWSMNFALMFALALGIDYALFIVVRYRAAHFGHGMTPADAAGVAMDTAGKAVLFSGVTVLISLSAVHARAESRLPLDGARDHGRRRLHPRRHAHAAAGRARRARPEGRQPLAQVGALRRAPLAALRPLGRADLGEAAALRRPRPARPARPRTPGARPEDGHAVDQGRPRRRQLACRLRRGTGCVRAGSPRCAADRRAERRCGPTRVGRTGRSGYRASHACAGLERRPLRARPGDPETEPLRSRGRDHDRAAAQRPAGRARSSAAPRRRTTISSALSRGRRRS